MLKFRDDDAKQDFLDWAIEENCMPTVKEVHQGEDKEEAEARKAKEAREAADKMRAAASAEMQRARQEAARAAMSPAESEARKISNRYAGLVKLRTSKKKVKPEKLARAEEALAAELAKYKADFPGELERLPEELQGEGEASAAAAAAPAAEEETA